MLMRFKNMLWAALTLSILVLIYAWTGADLSSINLLYVGIACTAFFLSLLFWGLAWLHLMRRDRCERRKVLGVYFKSVLGLFSPFGLGGDILRVYFCRKQGMSGIKALSTSMLVKFFKFLLMAVFVIIALYLISIGVTNFSSYAAILISVFIFAIAGAIIVLSFRIGPFVRLLYRLFNRVSLLRFHDSINQEFLNLSKYDVYVVLLFLLISSFFEVLAVFFAFGAVNSFMPLIQVFVFSAVAYSLALITVTPQGVGFVEAGGFFILSLGYFAMSAQTIGTFLIVWNIVRIWMPSAVGAAATMAFRE